MKEKVSKSQRTGLVMDCTDVVVLVFLLMMCGTTFVLSNGRKELNGPCQIVSECNTIGYFCARNRTCQCRSGYIPSEDWSKCVGFVGSKCIYDSHCIEGAYCTGLDGYEKCKCKEQENYFLNDDEETCTSSAISRFQHKLTFTLLLTLLSTSLYFNT